MNWPGQHNYKDPAYKLLHIPNPDFDQELFDADFNNDEPTYKEPSHLLLTPGNCENLADTFFDYHKNRLIDGGGSHKIAVKLLETLLSKALEVTPDPYHQATLKTLLELLKSDEVTIMEVDHAPILTPDEAGKLKAANFKATKYAYLHVGLLVMKGRLLEDKGSYYLDHAGPMNGQQISKLLLDLIPVPTTAGRLRNLVVGTFQKKPNAETNVFNVKKLHVFEELGHILDLPIPK